MLCDLCRSPEKADVTDYKTNAAYPHGKVTLCDECAEKFRNDGYKLTGGKAPEAKPSEPGPEAAKESAESNEPAARTRRRY